MTDEFATRPYGPLPDQLADVRLPPAPEAPVIVYFHGGGLEGGGRADNAGLFRSLVDAGIGVVSADYRLLPSARFLDFLDDAAGCVAWVARELPGRPLLVGGSSAGAYLAMMLCFQPRWLEAVDVPVQDVAGWLFDAGQPTTHFTLLRERGVDPRTIVVDDAAPLRHLGSRAAQAPTLILLASDDIPGRREQTGVLLAALRDFGLADDVRLHVLDGYQHNEYLHDDQPAGQALVTELVLDLVARATAGSGRG